MVYVLSVDHSVSHKRLILDLLEVLSFDIEPVAAPAWEFFEQGQMDSLMSQCEVGSSQGLKVSETINYISAEWEIISLRLENHIYIHILGISRFSIPSMLGLKNQ